MAISDKSSDTDVRAVDASHSDNRLPNLVDATQAIVDQLGIGFVGAHQVTHLQLVELLGRHFQISLGEAENVLSGLQRAGILQARPDRDDSFGNGVRDGWHLSVQRLAEFAPHPCRPPELETLTGEELDRPESDNEMPAVDLLQRAIDARATDIHFDPYGDEIEVRFRIDGSLEHYCRLSRQIGAPLVTQLKVMSRLDIADPFHPLEGRLELPLLLSDHEVRITTTPVTGGEAVALRILHHRQLVRPLEMLGLSSIALEKVQELLRHEEGLILVTGPTGAGKTTTVYSMLHTLDNGHRNIVTIEDPVEFKIPSFVQLDVDRKHDVTSPVGLRTLLRMDPDIVMLGEIRGSESANVAMRAASSGKYVFSTLHTRDVASTVTALRDLNVDSRSLAASLRAIISQRLIRRLCKICCHRRPLQKHERNLFDAYNIEPPDEVGRPIGCLRCRDTGFYERVGVFGIDISNTAVAMAIENGAAEDEIRDLFQRSASVSLAKDALLKVRDGITCLEEAQSMTWVSFASPKKTSTQ